MEEALVLLLLNILLFGSCVPLQDSGKSLPAFDRIAAANRKEMKEENVVQADIRLNDQQKERLSGTGRIGDAALLGTAGKWPNARVPFVINAILGSQARSAIQEAIADYNLWTCVRFVPRTSESDYIEFTSDGGCWSWIGRQSGRQVISIGQGCEYRSVTAHEMMHALGFFHEQSRSDRDDHVIVLLQNIMTGLEYNFDKLTALQATNLGVPYNKQSVMHYSNYAFSRNGLMTIQSKSNPSEILGRSPTLTQTDRDQVNIYYGCSGVTTPATLTTTPTTQATTTRAATTTRVTTTTTTQPPTTTRASTTTQPPTTTRASTTTQPATTTRASTTTQPSTTTRASTTTQGPTTTRASTTISTNGPTTPSDCTDKDALLCSHPFVQVNVATLCQQFPEMPALCPKSCQACDKLDCSTVVDTRGYETFCSTNRPFCFSSEWMRMNCKKTCCEAS